MKTTSFTTFFMLFIARIAATADFFQAALIRDDHVICSGTLIKPSFVLTTDYCVDGVHEIDVIIGSDDLFRASPTDFAMVCTTFMKERLVALIKLPVSGEYQDNVKHIDYTPDKMCNDRPLSVSGLIFSKQMNGLTLQKSEIVEVPLDNCQNLTYSHILTEIDSFCASRRDNLTMIADIGSPVYCLGGDLEMTFVGIVYNMSEDYAIVLQLDSYMNWIENRTIFEQ